MRSLSKVVKSYQVHIHSVKKIHHPEFSFIKPDEFQEESNGFDENKAELMLDNARVEAERIISEAQQTAGRILEDARQEISEMRILVLEEAREQGYQEGYNEIVQKAESILQEAEEIKKAARQEYNELMNRAEKDMIQIILDISKKIIGDELQERADKISSLVAQALAECKKSEEAVVKVSPEDYDGVHEHLNTIIRNAGYSGKLEIKKDVALSQGDCIIETPTDNIDASVKVQLEALEEALLASR